MLDPLLKLLKALNSDVGPWSLSFAAALALYLGLTPLFSPHNAVILLLALITRVHFATFVVFWGLYTAIAYLLDPWFHQIGLALLNSPELAAFWTSLYQSDVWQATRFNHSNTLGSFVVATAALLPIAILFRLSVVKYRANLMPWIDKLKVVQVLKGSKLFQLYERVGD